MSIYDTSTIGTNNNFITFNDFNADPVFRVVRRAPTKRELREFDIPIPENIGVADFQSFIGKTYFVLDGVMYPNQEITFHSGREKLRKLASLITEQADTLADAGYVPYKWSENIDKQLFLKVLYVDMQENTKLGLKQPFRLFCKVKYPAILAQSAVTVGIGDGTIPTPLGSSGLPFRLPVGLSKTSSSVAGSGNNTGDIPTYPSITIYGPISNPKISNTTTGEYIEFSNNLLAGETIVLAYDQDSLSITKGGNSIFNQMTSLSTLFKIQPGTNNFTLTGSTISTGSKAVLSFYPAWPLS